MPPSMRPYEPLRSMSVMWSRDGVLICMKRPFLFCLCCVVWEVMKVAGVSGPCFLPFLNGDAVCSEVLEVGDVCAGDFWCLGTAAVGEEGYLVVEGECVGDGCTDAVWVLGSGDEEVIGSVFPEDSVKAGLEECTVAGFDEDAFAGCGCEFGDDCGSWCSPDNEGLFHKEFPAGSFDVASVGVVGADDVIDRNACGPAVFEQFCDGRDGCCGSGYPDGAFSVNKLLLHVDEEECGGFLGHSGCEFDFW